MKTLYCVVLPQCNFCNEPALYDAPTSNFGQWGYMCESCSKVHSNELKLNMGTKFEIREIKPKQHDSSKALMGIEPSENDLEYWETVVSDGIRLVGCPTCKGERHLESDAEGKFECEFCGQKIMIPPSIII